MQSGIYIIRNIISGDFYIGSSINIKRRFYEHKTALTNNKHHSIILQRAWNKYGKDSFRFEELELIDNQHIICREQFYLDSLKPVYNICNIAGKGNTNKRSLEFIEKMKLGLYRARQDGRWMNSEHLLKMQDGRKRVGYSLEERKARSDRQKGNKFREISIIQYDREGNILSEYKSATEAARVNNWKDYSTITACCKGRRKSSHNYIWKYKNI